MGGGPQQAERTTPIYDSYFGTYTPSTEHWLDNTHTVGDRVRQSDVPDEQREWHQQYPRDQLHLGFNADRIELPIVPPTPIQAFSCRRQHQCDHSGCLHTANTAAALRQHHRYHIPAYPCPHCRRRYLCPREVNRHLPVHGRGVRQMCPHHGCRFSLRGFGRPDHLVRHIERVHNAAAAQYGSDSTQRL